MELSRRGVLGGLGAACAVGAVGFAGAVSVGEEGGDGSDSDDATTGAGDADGDGSGSDSEASTATSVAVDPEAPFEARLLREDGSDGGSGDGPGDLLFEAADLDYVQGVTEDEGEHLVGISLSEDGQESFRERLEASGAADDPEPFAVSMTLDGEEVRRVDLDDSTVAALTDEEWGGVLTLPFGDASVAESVYASLATE
ncbi:hypothetical protein [Halorubrum aethiopicum]|uniref:hypothetical protein n=1 Tax=Halorubrum aethiopicum TaxID=1758255 RepID=UPI000834D693|nr:hypothetical protein [Halorubrum aethiopicum]